MIADVLRTRLLHTTEPFAEIERKLSLPRGTLSKFANGRRGLTIDTADTLLTHFGLELVDGTTSTTAQASRMESERATHDGKRPFSSRRDQGSDPK